VVNNLLDICLALPGAVLLDLVLTRDGATEGGLQQLLVVQAGTELRPALRHHQVLIQVLLGPETPPSEYVSSVTGQTHMVWCRR